MMSRLYVKLKYSNSVYMYVCMLYTGAIAFDGSYNDFVKSSEFVSISTTEGNQQSDSEIDEGASAWNEVAYYT